MLPTRQHEPLISSKWRAIARAIAKNQSRIWTINPKTLGKIPRQLIPWLPRLAAGSRWPLGAASEALSETIQCTVVASILDVCCFNRKICWIQADRIGPAQISKRYIFPLASASYFRLRTPLFPTPYSLLHSPYFLAWGNGESTPTPPLAFTALHRR